MNRHTMGPKSRKTQNLKEQKLKNIDGNDATCSIN